MWFLAIAAAVSAAMSLASGVQQYQAAQESAKAQESAALANQQAAEYAATLAGRRAEALEIRAGQERAVSQRRAAEERRQGRIAQSRTRALAAASGASVASPSVVGILGDIDTEAEYRALTGLFEGEEAAKGLEFGAQLERAGGEGELFAANVESELASRRADITRAQGRTALIGGIGNAAQTGFSTIGGGAFNSGGATLFTRYGRRIQGPGGRLVGGV